MLHPTLSGENSGGWVWSLDEVNAHFWTISSVELPLTPLNIDNILMTESYYGCEQLSTFPTFKFCRITVREIENRPRRAKSRAKGPDRITDAMLKLLAPATLGLVKETFNASPCHTSFPKLWRRSFILPLPKCSTPKTLSDIRPIALLPEISKLLERAVHYQLAHYLESFSLLNIFQSGFRVEHSKQTALSHITLFDLPLISVRSRY